MRHCIIYCAFTSLIAHKSYAQLPCSVVISGEKLLGVIGDSTADLADCRLETAVLAPDEHRLATVFQEFSNRGLRSSEASDAGRPALLLYKQRSSSLTQAEPSLWGSGWNSVREHSDDSIETIA